MRKTMGWTVAASIALFSTPALADEASSDARAAVVKGDDVRHDGDASPPGREGTGDRAAHGTDATGAGAGEPATSAPAGDRARQQQDEQRFREEAWRGG